MIESVITVLKERPQGAKLLLEGNFNADLAQPEEAEQDKEIVVALTAAGLEDMSEHFLP